MKFVLAAIAATMLAAMAVVASPAGVQAAPSAGTLLASGLLSPIGAVVGPDGALYVAEGGTGGTTPFTGPDDTPLMIGNTGRVSRIDSDTGARTTEAEGIPSVDFGDGSGSGAIDVEFIGSTMYFLQTSGGAAFGFPTNPNGIYRVDTSTTFTLVADIGAFNDANPVSFPDAGPGGNPFALQVRGSEFIVTDGNYNRVLRAGTDGSISIIHSFDNVVPTGLESGDSGPFFMTEFGPGPNTPTNSRVDEISFPDGAVTEVATGYSNMIDVEAAAGDLFVLQFEDATADPAGPPDTGKILALEGSTLRPVVTGLFLPTSLDFNADGETAFVTTLTGDVYKIENFSAVAAAPTPTAVPATPTTAAATPVPATATRPAGTPSGIITAPNTGVGGGDGTEAPWTLIMLAIAGTSAITLGVAARRRQTG